MKDNYRLVTVIMNVTATMATEIPIMILVVSGSPNTSVPTTIAVIGSNTPSTEALVAPMLRDAMARVARGDYGWQQSQSQEVKPVVCLSDSCGDDSVGNENFT